jgi:beta-1,4-mannosyl-glycoprotein beta-1,4-N-acetylglucosaminyltransferase
MKPKIIDCFTFYNEVQMLEFRLEELGEFVDFFVIVEANKTFVGLEKEKNFPEQNKIVQKYIDKIVYVFVDDMPDGDDPWEREAHQRNCIIRGLDKISPDNDDIVIISDCDEVFDIETIKLLTDHGIDKFNGFVCLEQDMYYYNIETKAKNKWYHPKVCLYSNLKNFSTIDDLRLSRCNFVIRDGGWHFSYFGGVDMIKNKINNFSHQEFNNSKFTDELRINEAIEKSIDLFRRDGIEYFSIDTDDNEYLPKNYKMLV